MIEIWLYYKNLPTYRVEDEKQVSYRPISTLFYSLKTKKKDYTNIFLWSDNKFDIKLLYSLY